MRVAALYDIHGNLPALEAVLGEVADLGVDLIVVGGDVVPGPLPRESMEVLRRVPTPTRFIHGNGETDILALQAGEPLTRVPQRFHHAMRWVADQLHEEDLAAFAAWPLTTEVEVEGLGLVSFCHATPRDDNELFTRITPEERLRPIFDEVEASVVVCGHTHMQFDREVGGVRVLNAGSVGLPFGEPGAYWALLGPDVELRRTEYDTAAAAERLAAGGYPEMGAYDVHAPAPEAPMIQLFEGSALQ